MSYSSATPLRAGQAGDSDNTLLQKLLNVIAAAVTGEVSLATTGAKGLSADSNGITSGLTASQTLVAANAAREFLVIDNRTGADLFYRYGTADATTSAGGYSVRIPNGSSMIEGNWRGAITFICGAGAAGQGVNVCDVSS